MHSKDYKSRFANNLKKELPRIPPVKKYQDFKSFSDMGKTLSDLHINFDEIEPYPVELKEGDLRLAVIDDPKKFFYVKKMRLDITKSSIVYNANITIQNIPKDVFNYLVNSKSAIEWIIERYQVTQNDDTGISNDPNEYANIVMKDPKYPLLLLQRTITLSLKTNEIVKSLPPLDID